MPTTLTDKTTKQLDALLEAYPADNHPGTLLGVTNREGEILYLHTTGLKNVFTGEKYDTDTVFWVASCTKLVCSVAAMQLVEGGKVDLDEPIGRILPNLASPDVIVSSTDDSVETRKAKIPITLRMLLTHTAGYTYPWYNIHARRWQKINNVEHVFRPLGMPLVHEPGSRFDYSVSMDFVGSVIEAISGQTMDSYCKEHIFKPLGMNSSTWDVATRPDLEPRLATLHGWDSNNNSFTPRDWPHAVKDVPAQSGGGGLLTTGEDYLRILAAVLNGGEYRGVRILRAETVKDMFINQCADLPDLGALGTNARVESTDTSVASSALVLLPGHRKGWGLGHLLNLDDIPGGRKANSAEWGGVSNCFWVADPTSEVAFIIFNEVLPYGFPAFVDLINKSQEVIFAPGALRKE